MSGNRCEPPDGCGASSAAGPQLSRLCLRSLLGAADQLLAVAFIAVGDKISPLEVAREQDKRTAKHIHLSIGDGSPSRIPSDHVPQHLFVP